MTSPFTSDNPYESGAVPVDPVDVEEAGSLSPELDPAGDSDDDGFLGAGETPAYPDDPDDPDDRAAAVAAKTGPDAEHDGRFRHTFTLPPTDIVDADRWETTDGADDIHRANRQAVLELALHRGLHPKGDVSFDGSQGRLDGSWDLTYSVPVEPADETGGDAVAPSHPLDVEDRDGWPDTVNSGDSGG